MISGVFCQNTHAEENIRRWSDIKIDFTELDAKIKIMQKNGFVKGVRAWIHPSVDTNQMINFPEGEKVDLLAYIPQKG